MNPTHNSVSFTLPPLPELTDSFEENQQKITAAEKSMQLMMELYHSAFAEFMKKVSQSKERKLSEIELEDLKSETNYFQNQNKAIHAWSDRLLEIIERNIDIGNFQSQKERIMHPPKG